MGLSKKDRRELRESKVVAKRREKRSERNAIRTAVTDVLAGGDPVLVAREVASKRGGKSVAETPPPSDTVSSPRAAIPLERVGECRYEIPATARAHMRVPAVLIANELLLDDLRNDPALEQLANMASLPGVVGRVLAMPDCHHGYGFPVGGVAATLVDGGVVSPGGIGFDINCGVRLLRSSLDEKDLLRRQEKLADALYKVIPAGLGLKEGIELRRGDIAELLNRGADWAMERGYATEADLEVIESGGRIEGADASAVSQRAVARGSGQVGTLGSGNHFCEVQVVDEVYDPEAARLMGIERGQVCCFIHSGSRGLGHQVCQDHLDAMGAAMRRYDIHLPDRQLACAPIASPEGGAYLAAMRAAANFAFANRQGLTHRARDAFRSVFGDDDLPIIYDVSHNIAKVERHQVDGEDTDVLVHRKGATRAFPAGHPEIPERYRDAGQPVLIPGDMGRYSFIAVGTEQAMRDTFGSICHGAGRQLSRSAARKQIKGADVIAELRSRGILVRTPSPGAVAEEASFAYKDVANVVDVCERAGIARKVARLRPKVVVKG